jgi:hypothetical protein
LLDTYRFLELQFQLLPTNGENTKAYHLGHLVRLHYMGNNKENVNPTGEPIISHAHVQQLLFLDETLYECQ